MKLIDIAASTQLTSNTQDRHIHEMATLFEALGQYYVILNEGTLNELAAWDAIKRTGSKLKNAGSYVLDRVKSANDAIDRLGALAQQTAPVQGFDNAVDSIIKKIAGMSPKVADAARKYGEWAKKNPGKQSLIIGMLTAIVSVLTTPAGGAAAGAILRAGNELLKGEKASTAVGKGIKTASLAWVAGIGFEQLGNFVTGLQIKLLPMQGYKELVRMNISRAAGGSGFASINFEVVVTPEIGKSLEQLIEVGSEKASKGDFAGAQRLWDKTADLVSSQQYRQEISKCLSNNQQLLDKANSANRVLLGFLKGLSGAAQGAIAAGGSGEKKRELNAKPKPNGNKFFGSFDPKSKDYSYF